MKRKKIIRLLAVIYLVLLAALTLFSNQILMATLPQVTSGRANSRTVNGTYYNYVLPLDAVFTDQDGSCVFVLETRETPLGDRNYLRRVPVSVLDRDIEKNLVAVDGAITTVEQIVTSAKTTPKDGMQVRIED